jgi:hypothetical protein
MEKVMELHKYCGNSLGSKEVDEHLIVPKHTENKEGS